MDYAKATDILCHGGKYESEEREREGVKREGEGEGEGEKEKDRALMLQTWDKIRRIVRNLDP